MKVELHVNGCYEIELHPETEIERAIVSEMASRAERGQPVKLQGRGVAEASSFVIGVENAK